MSSPEIGFKNLFDLAKIQKIQDAFADAVGVASIITAPDGAPITAPSNFTRLCADIVRKTGIGLRNCIRSDAMLGEECAGGPLVCSCLGCGLWHGAARILVGERHIANWLIGQVRDADRGNGHISSYARQIGADPERTMEAYLEIPVMSRDRFEKVSQALYLMANQLSELAFENMQKAQILEDRRRAELRLRESEDQFRSLYVALSEGVALHELVYDAQGKAIDYRILDVNPAYEAILGLDRSVVIGAFASGLYGSGIAPYLDIYASVAQTQIPQSFEDYFEPLRKHFRVSVSSPKPGQFVTIFDDISTRKATEAALRASEERFRGLYEYSPIPFFEEDFSDGKEYFDTLRAKGVTDLGKYLDEHPGEFERLAELLRVVSINRAGRALFELPANAAAGQVVHHRIDTPSHRQAFRSGLIALWNGEAAFEATYTGMTATGRAKELLIRMTVAPDLRRPLSKVYATFVDLSDHVAAEQALRRAKEESDRANRSKSEFVANMSHEIRTPLHGMLGMIDLIDDARLTDEERDCLETAKSSGQALLTVINDVLDLSKIESGRMELMNSAFSLRDVVAKSTDILRPRALGKGIVFSVEVADSVPDLLFGDAGRLWQILVNLVGNAVKFTDRGGRVAVDLDSALSDDGRLTLHCAVKDSGIGIPPDKQQEIFKSFVQVDSSASRRYGGTGLGLTIASRLVELMDGRLWVESSIGKGSIFHFNVVLREPDDIAEVASRRVASDAERFGGTVLVAEDNMVNQKVVVRLLERKDCRVIVADNGKEALRLAGEVCPDLILMDCQMPEMDGFEATKELRRLENGSARRVPIVGLTAHAMEGDRERCLNAGMDEYIAKPFDRSSFYKIVSRYLSARLL